VHAMDEWEYSIGDGGRFFHRPKIHLPKAERGEPLFAYSFATLLSGGRTKVATTNREQAEEIRDKFARAGKSPWKTGFFDQMWLKSPVRQVQKWAPKSAEIRRALVMDGATFDVAGTPDVDPNDPNVIPGEVVDEAPESAAQESPTVPDLGPDPWDGIKVAKPGGGAA
jgi:recombination protein RecT